MPAGAEDSGGSSVVGGVRREARRGNAEFRPAPAKVQRSVPPWESMGWEREATPEGAVEPPPMKRNRRGSLPEHVVTELGKTVGRRSGRVAEALLEASKAYERERYGDALKIARPLLDDAPDSPSVCELVGLCLYRQGKWAEAIRHLSRFTELTGSVEQNPVLADCHRALRHYVTVQELWDELAASSPSAELVTEGRIVMAGALSDQGLLNDAIKLLERAPMGSKRARPHHLRLWYALGDLYERAGELPRARDLFTRVFEQDPQLSDVAQRLANLA